MNVEDEPISPRLDSLAGKAVGFLDNSKHNADTLLDEIETVLTAEYDVETVSRRKDKSPIPADSIADQLAGQCDVVVNAYGDCGSCTSWCVYDSVDLERKGTPVATVVTDEFTKLAQSETRSLGMSGLPLVVVPHPMGGIEKAEVRDRARAVVDEVVYTLTTPRQRLEDEYRDRFLAEGGTVEADDFFCPL